MIIIVDVVVFVVVFTISNKGLVSLDSDKNNPIDEFLTKEEMRDLNITSSKVLCVMCEV